MLQFPFAATLFSMALIGTVPLPLSGNFVSNTGTLPTKLCGSILTPSPFSSFLFPPPALFSTGFRFFYFKKLFARKPCPASDPSESPEGLLFASRHEFFAGFPPHSFFIVAFSRKKFRARPCISPAILLFGRPAVGFEDVVVRRTRVSQKV